MTYIIRSSFYLLSIQIKKNTEILCIKLQHQNIDTKKLQKKDIFRRLPCCIVMWPTNSAPTLLAQTGHTCTEHMNILYFCADCNEDQGSASAAPSVDKHMKGWPSKKFKYITRYEDYIIYQIKVILLYFYSYEAS